MLQFTFASNYAGFGTERECGVAGGARLGGIFYQSFSIYRFWKLYLWWVSVEKVYTQHKDLKYRPKENNVFLFAPPEIFTHFL